MLTARLRDARFFWDADRKVPLEQRIARLDTILFHKRLGTYRQKAERVERLARSIAADVLGVPAAADDAARAGRLAKADLATDMVRELTELQGTMGGIYAREEGQPEPVWKAIYHHYLPVAVESDAPPTRETLGAAAVTWAAVSLADKLDTLVGLFRGGRAADRVARSVRTPAAGARNLPNPRGSAVHSRDWRRDPRSAHSWTPRQPAFRRRRSSTRRRARRSRPSCRSGSRTCSSSGATTLATSAPCSRRGRSRRVSPLVARRMLEALPEFTGTPEFTQLATAFKRVKNIAKELDDRAFAAAEAGEAPLSTLLLEPAEAALVAELERRRPAIEQALAAGDQYRRAFAEAAGFGPAVDRFFTDVFVMVDDQALRRARLRLMKSLARLILSLADISEIVPQTES